MDNSGAMISQTLEFRFDKCQVKFNPDCKSDEEIMKWIQDLNIELYTIFQNIDYK